MRSSQFCKTPLRHVYYYKNIKTTHSHAYTHACMFVRVSAVGYSELLFKKKKNKINNYFSNIYIYILKKKKKKKQQKKKKK